MSKLKTKLFCYLMRHLFNAINDDDILTITRNGYQIGNRVLDKNQIEGLKNEAQVFKNSDVWDYVNNNLKYLANYRMYHGSKTVDDLVFGKAMLYNLDIINRLFNKISER